MNNLIKSFFSLLLLIGFTASVSAAETDAVKPINNNNEKNDLIKLFIIISLSF